MNHEETWALCNIAMLSPAVKSCYLWGPPGIGKTYSAYTQLRNAREVYAVTLTEETPAAELRGHYIPKGNEMVWHDGPFTRAMKEGSRLVINEVTHGSPDVWSILYPILESRETARLTLPTGETVIPHEDFHVICTDNCQPESLPLALQDRFDVTIHLTVPHSSAYDSIDENLRPIIKRMIEDKEEDTVTLRGWYSVQSLVSAGCSYEQAITMSLGNSIAAQNLIDSITVALPDGKTLEEI